MPVQPFETVPVIRGLSGNTEGSSLKALTEGQRLTHRAGVHVAVHGHRLDPHHPARLHHLKDEKAASASNRYGPSGPAHSELTWSPSDMSAPTVSTALTGLFRPIVCIFLGRSIHIFCNYISIYIFIPIYIYISIFVLRVRGTHIVLLS